MAIVAIWIPVRRTVCGRQREKVVVGLLGTRREAGRLLRTLLLLLLSQQELLQHHFFAALALQFVRALDVFHHLPEEHHRRQDHQKQGYQELAGSVATTATMNQYRRKTETEHSGQCPVSSMRRLQNNL
mgnify:CR=1 FL=1